MNTDNPIVALVDDDKIFRLTASKTIIGSNLTDKILQFENGEKALNFLKANASNTKELPDYIFLDINMPFVDGWMFMEDFAAFKSDLSKQITIYMVSSSIDPSDINKAKRNENIKEYIVKPVSKDRFAELLKKVA